MTINSERKDKITLKYRNHSIEYPVKHDPCPHVLIPTKSVIHGWMASKEKKGRRACTAERFLLNPYKGCTHRCNYPCYTRAFRRFSQYYREFWENNIVVVVPNFVKVLQKELESPNLKFAAWSYLSATTDVFQKPLEDHYQLTYSILQFLKGKNLGFEFVTKSTPNNKVLDLCHDYPHCFTQFTVNSLDNEYTRLFEPHAASSEERLESMRKFSEMGTKVVHRLDPIEPFFTDSERNIRETIEHAADAGAFHCIISISDKALSEWRWFLDFLTKNGYANLIQDYEELYSERHPGERQAKISYRREKFSFARKIAKKNGMTFALCNQFEKVRKGDSVWFSDLNKEFMTSHNCEGVDTPLFRKNSQGKWIPLKNCTGNCIYGCSSISCGISDLRRGLSLKISDWRRFSRGQTYDSRKLRRKKKPKVLLSDFE